MPVVELDVKALQIRGTLSGIAGYQRLWRDALRLGFEHDGGAMRVISTDKMHGVSCHAHGSHPDICLDVLHDVANVK